VAIETPNSEELSPLIIDTSPLFEIASSEATPSLLKKRSSIYDRMSKKIDNARDFVR
jgi:hypothetical protein